MNYLTIPKAQLDLTKLSVLKLVNDFLAKAKASGQMPNLFRGRRDEEQGGSETSPKKK